MSIFILTALVASYVLLGIASDNLDNPTTKRRNTRKGSHKGARQ